MPWSNSLSVFIIFCKISLRIHFSLQITFYFPQKQFLLSRILMKCYNRLFIPGFASSLSRESSEWKALQHCQTVRFPEPWNHQLSSFQKLIVIKILFPHQVGDCCWSKFVFFHVEDLSPFFPISYIMNHQFQCCQYFTPIFNQFNLLEVV